MITQIRGLWAQVRGSVDQLEVDLSRLEQPRPTSRMCKYLIVAEDHRFALHPGVDPLALVRAAWKTCFSNSRQGGSTIAMQLVRTILGHCEPTFKRKAEEIVLAVLLSRYVAKERVPRLYLSCAYYGWKMNNFVEACTRLGIDTATATEFEEAQLVARIKYPQPREYHARRMEQIRRRASHVLSLSDRKGLIFGRMLRTL